MMKPFTFTEELVLLALDDRTGAPLPLPVTALAYGLAGAVLADLAVAGKIDTDDKKLVVLDATPTGDPLLDPWLALIAAEKATHSVAHWLSVLADRQKEIEQPALDRLLSRGILATCILQEYDRPRAQQHLFAHNCYNGIHALYHTICVCDDFLINRP